MRPTIARLLLAAPLVLAACDARREDGKVVVEVDTARAEAEARQAGREIREGAQQAGAALNAGKQELDIRAALALDDTIDRSNVAFALDESTRTIRLLGSVPDAAQSARVEAIAREKAEDWTIVNELAIAAGPAPATGTMIAPGVVLAPGATAAAPAPASGATAPIVIPPLPTLLPPAPAAASAPAP